MEDIEFRRHADAAIDGLKKSLIAAEDNVDMEVEENAGALHISFDDPPGEVCHHPQCARQANLDFSPGQ